MAKKTENQTPETPSPETPETPSPETETNKVYTINIYGEKKSEATGKMRRTVAGTVRSTGASATAAVDDLKAVLAKIPAEKLAKIVEIRIIPETNNGGEPEIRL